MAIEKDKYTIGFGEEDLDEATRTNLVCVCRLMCSLNSLAPDLMCIMYLLAKFPAVLSTPLRTSDTAAGRNACRWYASEKGRQPMQRDHRGDRGPSGLRYGFRRHQHLDAWILRRTNRHWHIVHIAGAVHRSMALIHEKVTSKLRWSDFQKFVSVPLFGGMTAFAARGSLDCDTRSVCVCFSNMPSGSITNKDSLVHPE